VGSHRRYCSIRRNTGWTRWGARALGVLDVLVEHHVSDLLVERDLRVERLELVANSAPNPALGLLVTVVELDGVEDGVVVFGRRRELLVLSRDFVDGRLERRLEGRVARLVVGVVEQPEIVVVLVGLLDARLAEAVAAYDAVNGNPSHALLLES